MVFDLGGVHCLVVRYCGCGSMGACIPKHTQLLHARWFPATIDRPSMAFVFDLLDFFHKLQSCNKCNPYDFYHTIIQRTNAAGLDPEIVGFSHFHIFCHLPILYSIVTMRSHWCFAFGVISNSSNEEVSLSNPVTSRPRRMEVSRSCVLLAHTLGRILLSFLRTNCMNDCHVVVRVTCTHLCCKDGKTHFSSE